MCACAGDVVWERHWCRRVGCEYSLVCFMWGSMYIGVCVEILEMYSLKPRSYEKHCHQALQHQFQISFPNKASFCSLLFPYQKTQSFSEELQRASTCQVIVRRELSPTPNRIAYFQSHELRSPCIRYPELTSPTELKLPIL